MSVRIDVEPGPEGRPRAQPLYEAIWPSGTGTPAPWGHVVWAQAVRRILLCDDDGGETICHVGLHVRDATWDGQAVRIGGVGGVLTRADSRRRGFATAAMKRAAQELAETHKGDFALLFCEPHNFAFYRALGWRPFEGDVFVEQPHGRVHFEVMAPFVLDLRLQPRAGVIDLCGLPW